MAKILKIKQGQKFNRLTFVNFIESDNRWTQGLFICECGNNKVTRISRVIANDCKSCGCLNKELARDMCKGLIAKTHGLTSNNLEGKRIYNIHNSIKSRCYHKNTREYKWYGGRGIVMCDEWLKNPLAFYDWCIKNGCEKGLHIDRINNDKDYSPDNCRFVTSKVNMNNTSSNKIIEFNNIKYTVSQLADLLGMTYSCLSTRIKRGWEMDRVINEKVRIVNK